MNHGKARRDRGDGDAGLPALAHRLVPAGRREWARAMRAELSAIDDRRARREFALGVLWAMIRIRVAPGPILTAVLFVGATVTAAAASSDVQWAPLRAGLLALVVLVLVVARLLRGRRLLGPSSRTASARTVNATGSVLVAAMILTVITDMRGPVANPAEKLGGGLPI